MTKILLWGLTIVNPSVFGETGWGKGLTTLKSSSLYLASSLAKPSSRVYIRFFLDAVKILTSKTGLGLLSFSWSFLDLDFDYELDFDFDFDLSFLFEFLAIAWIYLILR